MPGRSGLRIVVSVAWYNWHLNLQNKGSLSYFRSPKNMIRQVPSQSMNLEPHTLGNGKEPDGDNSVSMCMPNSVVNIPHRKVERVVLDISSHH